MSNVRKLSEYIRIKSWLSTFLNCRNTKLSIDGQIFWRKWVLPPKDYGNVATTRTVVRMSYGSTGILRALKIVLRTQAETIVAMDLLHLCIGETYQQWLIATETDSSFRAKHEETKFYSPMMVCSSINKGFILDNQVSKEKWLKITNNVNNYIIYRCW